eukprot:CAMPEP_0202857484 /NCGR_PEP_ID=MMETSP1391-20130828/405_1 /ASSEMBLY_ACC=CAM_ASM_000867 /TAXON_ID=1034604 /ORGANISM="Chlamydomonas leiostraca, Strain SAG 11-49" /LENGTH=262 /DNA_ID=CAMNT_0049536289 /DNA_START=84 /DNA_END=872 /DNA_ORIENTATION=+
MKAGVFVGGAAVRGAAVEQFLQAASVSLSSLEFVCTSEAGTSGQYDVALVASTSGQHVTKDTLAACSRCLAAGATIYVHEQDASKSEDVLKQLLLSGFVESQVVTSGTSLMVRAKRPQWELGAKSALSLKRPAAAPVAAAPATAEAAWKISADDEDEIVDEDELLTEEDKQRPVAAPAADDGGDCSTSRKACKNCSCGRAEKEAAGEKVALTQEMLDNPQSSCGNCSLGDAFRCAGCPYRGLPAFEPGKKITLGSDFLTADA